MLKFLFNYFHLFETESTKIPSIKRYVPQLSLRRPAWLPEMIIIQFFSV